MANAIIFTLDIYDEDSWNSGITRRFLCPILYVGVHALFYEENARDGA